MKTGMTNNRKAKVEMPPQETASLESRCSIEHKVKSWPQLFEAALSGAKSHDMRKCADRDYRVGDKLRLQEYDPASGRYTGRELLMKITYITSAKFPCALSGDGLHPDYCILSITKC